MNLTPKNMRGLSRMLVVLGVFALSFLREKANLPINSVAALAILCVAALLVRLLSYTLRMSLVKCPHCQAGLYDPTAPYCQCCGRRIEEVAK